MDVRFCRVQEPTAERQTCAAAAPDRINNALSRARTDNSRFSVDKDLHGCRLYGQKPVFLTLSLRPRIESMSDSAIMR
jgi:hypothetical protein